MRTSSKRNKSSSVATKANDHSIDRGQYKTTKQANKRIRYLHLSPNVNDYDTGETDIETEKGSASLSIRSKKTGNKFQDLEK
ncbi:MAG: hypothetical protein WA667_03435 [Candidatus Nitrosopolaris sp.]